MTQHRHQWVRPKTPSPQSLCVSAFCACGRTRWCVPNDNNGLRYERFRVFYKKGGLPDTQRFTNERRT